VLQAAATLAERGIVEPLLVGERDAITRAASKASVDLSGVTSEAPRGSALRDECLAAVEQAIRGKHSSSAALAETLNDPLYFAAAMVRAGKADGLVAGAAHATSATLRAVLRIIRPETDSGLVSSFFLMLLDRPAPSGAEVLAFADCGMVPDPDPDQLVEIGCRTAASFRLLVGEEPKLAFLSFSTRGSASHQAVDKVVAARERMQELGPDFVFDGELQLDAALVPEIAKSKAPDSPVAGEANVLIFPDLNAGNIGYKLVERLAGAQAIGPILQGLSGPANDLSRGCSVDDIVVAAAVTAIQAQAVDDRPPL